MKIAVVGAGASGLFFAANCKGDVTVYDGNNTCGKKLLLTGGGRCNLTQNCDSLEFLEHVARGDKFLRSALVLFSPANAIDWFAAQGVKVKCEQNRAFPATNSAETILNALVGAANKNGVCWKLNAEVKSIERHKNGFFVNGNLYDTLVLATGGKSYAVTGSRGAGYKFAKSLGLSIIEPKSALCPIAAIVDKMLQGVSCYVKISLFNDDKKVSESVGNVMFAHFGLSGPAALNATAWADIFNGVQLNFFPDKTMEQLKFEIKEFKIQNAKKGIKAALQGLLPKTLIEYILKFTGMANKPVGELSNKDIDKICQTLCCYKLKASPLGIDSGMVTSGGVCLNEINPKTMESKKVPNLFVIGELLDAHGETGGYNLQIAWSSAFAAAKALEAKL